MSFVFWLAAAAAVAALGYWLSHLRRQWGERERAAEARRAAFLAEMTAAVRARQQPEEKLLFEAATKAAEAGEPALAIQLYGRLLARFPQTAFAPQVRAAVQVQKEYLAKVRNPDTSGRG